jgi:DNA-binding GntR family transcriptional regulator
MSSRISSSSSLTEKAVNTIRDRILDLTLAPGIRIDERLLMARFKLSRTPAREALNRLAAEGLVDIEANKGAFVCAIDVSQINRFFDAYHAAERLVGFLCILSTPGLVDEMDQINVTHQAAVKESRFLDVARLNAAFHLTLAEATENQYVADFSARLHNHAQRLAYLIYRRESEDGDFLDTQQSLIIGEHTAIIDAIRRGDRDTLVAALTTHARRFQDRIARFVGRSRSGEFTAVE